jgi:hypothetical protein
MKGPSLSLSLSLGMMVMMKMVMMMDFRFGSKRRIIDIPEVVWNGMV